MKYLIITFLFSVSLSLSGQPSVTLKPGTTDSARWELTRELVDGSTVSYLGVYDTLPNIIEFGKELYRSGGFIGGGRIPPVTDYYSDSVLDFIRTQGIPMNNDREVIAGILASVGSSGDQPMIYDTLTNYSFIGTWVVEEASCGMPNDTIVVRTTTNANGGLLEALDINETSAFGTVQNIGLGVISVLSPSQGFGQMITIVQKDSTHWEGPIG